MDDEQPIPNEIIVIILEYLDLKSLIQLSYTCALFKGLVQPNINEFKLYKHPLMDAVKNEWINGNINPKNLYTSLVNNEFSLTKALLFKNEFQNFILYLPCYEEKKIPHFFANPSRRLYLTEELAKEKTPNSKSVKRWFKAKVSLDEAQFKLLYETQMISYNKPIPLSALMLDEIKENTPIKPLNMA